MSKWMPGGDCVLRQEVIHRLGVAQGYGCISNVVGQSPLPELVDGPWHQIDRFVIAQIQSESVPSWHTGIKEVAARHPAGWDSR
jgi:hypothetical protein